jgi:hypothetical protein
MRYRNVELHNVRAVEELPGGGVAMSRVPSTLRPLLNPAARRASLNGCGCEIRFVLRGAAAPVSRRRPPADPCDPVGVAEVWFGPFQGGFELCPRLIGPEPTVISVRYPPPMAALEALAGARGLPFDPRVVRVLLPYDMPTDLLAIEGDVAPPAPRQTPQRRLLAYGSSITHGGSALAPSATYAMRVARALGYDLLNLGFAGSAQLEPELAHYLADELAWDAALLELGVNVLDRWSADRFADAARRFVAIVAGAGRPLLVTDILTCAEDLAGDPKLAAFRAAVAGAVTATLARAIYVAGGELLPDAALLSADLLHPSAAGMELIADELHWRLAALLTEAS